MLLFSSAQTVCNISGKRVLFELCEFVQVWCTYFQRWGLALVDEDYGDAVDPAQDLGFYKLEGEQERVIGKIVCV